MKYVLIAAEHTDFRQLPGISRNSGKMSINQKKMSNFRRKTISLFLKFQGVLEKNTPENSLKFSKVYEKAQCWIRSGAKCADLADLEYSFKK